MLVSIKTISVATLLALHALAGPIYANNPHCHVRMTRYADPNCERRPDADQSWVYHAFGTDVRMGVCEAWDGQPFRSVEYEWVGCGLNQRPWRRAMGDCFLNLYESDHCANTGRNFTMQHMNARFNIGHLNAQDQMEQDEGPLRLGNCVGMEGDLSVGISSVLYDCYKPGVVNGY